MKILAAMLMGGTIVTAANAETNLTPNGFSGLGIIPNADVLSAGYAVIDHARALPGAANSSGHNNQVGFGLTKHLEFVGRLATQDLHCNMFRPGCPQNQIRDVSGSFKLLLPLGFLEPYGARLALGTVDVGGAASYFRSDYLVGTKRIDAFDITLGHARSKGSYAVLGNQPFGGITWSPNDWAKLNVQVIGSQASTHIALSTPPAANGVSAMLTLNRRLTESLKTPEDWLGVSVAIPLDGIKPLKRSGEKQTGRVVPKIDETHLITKFEEAGLYNPQSKTLADGTKFFRIENTAYAWNALDAAGVALGLIVGVYGDKPQPFKLIITARGIDQLVVSGESVCVKKWLQNEAMCDALKISSALSGDVTSNQGSMNDLFHGSLRPEFIVSPLITSGIGTEFGALDVDVGLNANLVMPLWKGGIYEVNRVEPLGFNTKDFERGRPFYAARIQSAVSRRMFHQIFNFPLINTQTRLSTGTMHTRWNGEQIETQSTTNDGRHRLSLLGGQFKDETRPNIERDYMLYSYRYALDAAHRYTPELTYGKFWNGDKGFQVGQRFWYGDTNLNIYIRRTKISDGSPFISFAGVQISLPITPRKNTGARYATVRGVNQWTYTIESRILENANPVGGGFGEVPNSGENLQRIFNRDRSGDDYLQSEIWRLKDAFVNLH